MSRSSFLFTSESVSEGHPDKVADRISDTIVDLFLAKDPYARVACETLTTTNLVVLAGEIRGQGIMDANDQWAPGVEQEIEAAVRAAVRDIGYEQTGFHWNKFEFINRLHGQSAHIAVGVDASGNKDEGAGDQGIMFGYASNETPELMPATLQYSHNILKRLAEVRHAGDRRLEPDAKSQVTIQYEDGVPVRATSIVLSTQHAAGLSSADVADIVKPHILAVLPEGFTDENTVWHINPTGIFEIGGPDGDAGVTGRKIIVDTYGGAAPHGGGAFSGKALPGQECRRRRPRRPLHHPDFLRHRRGQTPVDSRRPPRHRQGRDHRGGAGGEHPRPHRRCHPARHPRAPGSEQADLRPHRRLRPFRPRAGRRRRLQLGEDRSGRSAEGSGLRQQGSGSRQQVDRFCCLLPVA